MTQEQLQRIVEQATWRAVDNFAMYAHPDKVFPANWRDQLAVEIRCAINKSLAADERTQRLLAIAIYARLMKENAAKETGRAAEIMHYSVDCLAALLNDDKPEKQP